MGGAKSGRKLAQNRTDGFASLVFGVVPGIGRRGLAEGPISRVSIGETNVLMPVFSFIFNRYTALIIIPRSFSANWDDGPPPGGT